MPETFDHNELDTYLTAEQQLVEDLGKFAYDPVGFVYWAFPWGEPNTDLANLTGPYEWQLTILEALRDGIIDTSTAVLLAVTSGHGVGKSALVAWIIWWAFSTFEGTRGVVTANTETQLKTKTWVEIAKWHRLFIAKHLFQCTATAIFAKDESTKREWRIDIVPWSERNVEAFAGLHNAGKRIIILFDEASAIPDLIWETTEGALTDKDTEIIWAKFGNPTKRNTRFFECFGTGKFAKRYFSLEVDSRSVPGTDKNQIDNWIEDYGIDSDFIRVRVLGKFPKTDGDSFISSELIGEALARDLPSDHNDQDEPFVLGVDCARHGEDCTVIYPRLGLDARSTPPVAFPSITQTALAALIITIDQRTPFDMIYIDTAEGGGVIDILREAGLPVFEVAFGSRADGLTREHRCLNKRAEMWSLMREFLSEGIIVNKVEGTEAKLEDELQAPGYYFSDADKLVLESKRSMRVRKISSPDIADALACTFAFPATKLRSYNLELYNMQQNAPAATYNPYAPENLPK